MSAIHNFISASVFICFLTLFRSGEAQVCASRCTPGPKVGIYNVFQQEVRGCDGSQTTAPLPAGVKPEPTPFCSRYQRYHDGYCNNDLHKEDGRTDSSQFAYTMDRSGERPRGINILRSARSVSNIVGYQPAEMPNSDRISDFTTYFGQFLDHNLFLTVEADEDKLPIDIPADDGAQCNFTATENRMPFARSKRGCVRDYPEVQRAVNCLTSVIDLAGVYGAKWAVTQELRKFKKGLMKSKKKKKKEYLPFVNTLKPKKNLVMSSSLMALPSGVLRKKEKKFFVAGDRRANENEILVSFHTLFLRNHNRLARDLRKKLKNKPIPAEFNNDEDEMIYQFAKRVNEATFQAIIAKEFYQTMTGDSLGLLEYNKKSRHSVSDVFSASAFRVGHTMIGPTIQLRDENMKLTEVIQTRSIFFNENTRILKIGIEPFLRGAVKHHAQEIDTRVTDALRNHLFSSVAGHSAAVDLLSLNIQRGRDQNIQRYNEIREQFNLKKVTTWEQISRDPTTQTLLSTAYKTIDEVEAWVGLMAEDHAPGRPMGRTMLKIWEIEFGRVINGDRFFYKGPTYHPLLYSVYQDVINDLVGDRIRMRDIILLNTDIDASTFPQDPWHF